MTPNDALPYSDPPHSAPSHSELPHVVIVSATPIEGEWATSNLLRSLFENWSPDKLSQIVLERDGVDAQTQPIRTMTVALDGLRDPRKLVAAMRSAQAFCAESHATVLYFRSAGWPMALEALPLWLKRRTGLHLVTHLMDDWPSRLARTRPRLAPLATRALRATLRASDACLAISEPMAEAYRSQSSQTFQVVHNGTAPHLDGLDGADGTAAPGGTPNRPLRIVYSGGAAVDQSAAALDDAIGAVELLVDRGIEVQLDLALSPRYVDEMREKVHNRPAVRVLDFVEPDEFSARLRSADVLLMAFNFDPTSVALLRLSMANKVGDYLAARRPIVVYGPSELATVTSAQSLGWGEVVDRRGEQRLADCLAAVLDDPERRSELVEAAARAAQTDFDLNEQRRRFEAALSRS